MSVPLQKCVCWSCESEGRSVLRRGAALLLDLVVDRRLHLGEQRLGHLKLGTVRAGPLLLELLGVVALPVLLQGLDLLVDLGDELLDGLRLLLQDVALGVDLIVVHSEPSHDLLLCLCSPDRFGKFSSGPTVQARTVPTPRRPPRLRAVRPDGRLSSTCRNLCQPLGSVDGEHSPCPPHPVAHRWRMPCASTDCPVPQCCWRTVTPHGRATW